MSPVLRGGRRRPRPPTSTTILTAGVWRPCTARGRPPGSSPAGRVCPGAGGDLRPAQLLEGHLEPVTSVGGTLRHGDALPPDVGGGAAPEVAHRLRSCPDVHGVSVAAAVAARLQVSLVIPPPGRGRPR